MQLNCVWCICAAFAKLLRHLVITISRPTITTPVRRNIEAKLSLKARTDTSLRNTTEILFWTVKDLIPIRGVESRVPGVMGSGLESRVEVTLRKADSNSGHCKIATARNMLYERVH